MTLKALIFSILLLSSAAVFADTSSDVTDLALVTNFIVNQDYPELFLNKPYHVKIENIFASNVLNDGTNDVIVLVTPNYRQSATLLIYEILKDKTVTRVPEGLAPGPLVPVTGKYLDSHALGEGVDLSLKGKQSDAGTRRAFYDVTFGKFGGVVAYPDFFHVDGRHGPVWFVDKSDTQSPLEGRDCSKFEFSPVDAIAAGQINGAGADNYLVAKVGDNLYVYLVNGLKDGKFLNKKSWVMPAPADFFSFTPGNPSKIQYQTRDGQTKDIAIPTLSKE